MPFLRIVLQGLTLALAMTASAPLAQHLALAGGPVELRLTAAADGTATGSDATTWIEWEGFRRPKKITIETSAPGQVYGLEAVVVGLQGDGDVLPPVALTDGMWPHDLVRSIKNRKQGSGYVQYTATATVDGGYGGTDAHLVTFTMTDQ